MTLVTAAIPTYNRGRYLVESIESVLAQTYEPVEVVVVDDGSTDETRELVQPYLDRIRYVRQDNAGRSAARNTALREARGDLIGFCDSDDRWLPDRLERQVPVFANGAEIGMVHGHVQAIDAQGRVLADETAFHRRVFSAAHRRGVTYAGYAWECRCFSSTILVRRETFDRVGLYDPALLLDDYDLYLRVALDYEIVFLEGPPLAQYRLHPGQMTSDELTIGQIQTAEKHLRLLAERGDIPDARRARRNLQLMRARSYRVLGDRRQARRAALAALRLGEPRALRFVV